LLAVQTFQFFGKFKALNTLNPSPAILPVDTDSFPKSSRSKYPEYLEGLEALPMHADSAKQIDDDG
jgi:hypothetical protein